jgi:HEAT repeat protein
MKAIIGIAAFLVTLLCSVSAGEETVLDKEVDELFIQASNPEAHHQHLVEPAREKLTEMGELAVPRLVSKLATEDARERHALADIFKRIGPAAVPALIEALDTENLSQLRNTARSLGEVGDKSATSALLPLFVHANHTVRSAAVTSVGKCHDSTAVVDCISLLSDSVEPVRKSAAVALGRIADARAVPTLIDALGDSHYSVRMSAVGSLTAIKGPACDALIRRYDSLSDVAGYLAFEVWSGCGYVRAKKIIEKATYSSDRYTRAFAINAFAAIDGKAARKRIGKMIRDESDLFVLSCINAALNILDSESD